MHRIVLTGGGTAGHVTANLALIPHLQKEGWEIHYIGSHQGIERDLLAAFPFVTYHGISCGKLRRYRDLRNLTDPFRVIKGIFQSIGILRSLRPSLIFAKGGFVSVPVAIGGFFNRIPVLLHESDLSMGLANRLCAPFAKAILTTFPEAATKFPKGIQTGTPLRAELFSGDRARGLALCGFTDEKPVLLVTGGSSGAVAVNQLVRETLPSLLSSFQIVHLCGRGHLDPTLDGRQGYCQFEYQEERLPDIFAMADILISRAGSTTISEILALRKPALLIPYPSTSSRGDQIENARNMEKRQLMMPLMQEEATSEILLTKLMELWENRANYIQEMGKITDADGTEQVLKQIHRFSSISDASAGQ